MRRMVNKSLLTFCGMMMALLLLSSCERKGESEIDFLTVKMSSNDRWSIIDKNGKEVVKEEYLADADVSLVYDGVFWVKTNGKYQLYAVAQPKKPVSTREYTWVTLFHAGRAAVSNPNHPIQIIDTKGKVVATLPENVKRCSQFMDDGYAVFEKTDGMTGVININGKVVVAAEYEFAGAISDGVLIAIKPEDEEKRLILNIKGKKLGEIDGHRYQLLSFYFCEGKIAVRMNNEENGDVIILDKTGKKLFSIRKAQNIRDEGYKDGYITFTNQDWRCGVADDKGEVVIRAKYNSIFNLGNGEFAAKKDDKWGVVDAKDEVVIDFDYEGACDFKLGKNYVMKDRSDFVVVGKDGKECTAFNVLGNSTYGYALYVNVAAIADDAMSIVTQLEQTGTAAQVALQTTLKAEDNRYTSRFSYNKTVGDVTASGTVWYDGNLVEEKTHKEKVDDGWFTYDRTVSDGYRWTNALPSSIEVDLKVNTSGLDKEYIIKAINEKLAQGRKKVSEGVFSKNVKVGGKTLECRTSVTEKYDGSLSLTIRFRK